MIKFKAIIYENLFQIFKMLSPSNKGKFMVCEVSLFSVNYVVMVSRDKYLQSISNLPSVRSFCICTVPFFMSINLLLKN